MSSNDKILFLYDKIKASYKQSNNMFNDTYQVYLELLFNALYGEKINSAEWNLRYSIFLNLINEYITNASDFDKNKFLSEAKLRFNNKSKKAYTVYFGIPVKISSSASFPAGRQFTIGGVVFQVRTYEQIKRVDHGRYVEELKGEYAKKKYSEAQTSTILRNSYVYFRARRPHYDDENVAVNRVASAFEKFSACATIIQEKNKKVSYWMSGEVKNRKPIPNPHLLYVKSSSPYLGLYVNHGTVIDVPNTSLSFTDNAAKNNLFKKYLGIVTDSRPTPIESRISDFIKEFDRALDTQDSHVRMLGLWRCLEIATRDSQGNARKQPEIIDIIARYYSNDDAWKEEGKLILKLRNGYVHQGLGLQMQTRDYYLGWLQDYARIAFTLLMWMYDHKIGKKSLSEIDDFFDMYLESVETLAIGQRILNARKHGR